MREIRLKARAKINLTLDVTGKREDGYHLLETIMQTVALYDGIYMKKLEKPVIKLKTCHGCRRMRAIWRGRRQT